ncbi:MAG: hypothetical protein AB7J28_16185 [Hyphomonadaceae bacterium]
MLRTLAAAFALAALASCATHEAPPSPLPPSGPIIYSCADGTQLQVSFVGNEARVAIVGGVSMALPNIGTDAAPHYSNGRYGLRGRGARADWEVGRAAPVACEGR